MRLLFAASILASLPACVEPETSATESALSWPGPDTLPDAAYDWGISCPSGTGLSGRFIVEGGNYAQATGATDGELAVSGLASYRLDLFSAPPSKLGCGRLIHAGFELAEDGTPHALGATLATVCTNQAVNTLEGCALTVGFSP